MGHTQKKGWQRLFVAAFRADTYSYMATHIQTMGGRNREVLAIFSVWAV